jgi:predicted esterase
MAILGFSQGVSTSMRWLFQSTHTFDSVFLVAGSIPPELKTNNFLNTLPFRYYSGTKDGLLTKSAALNQVAFLKALKLKVIHQEFNGKHEIPELAKEEVKQFSLSVEE